MTTEPEQSAVEALAEALKLGNVHWPYDAETTVVDARAILATLPEGWHLTRDDASHDVIAAARLIDHDGPIRDMARVMLHEAIASHDAQATFCVVHDQWEEGDEANPIHQRVSHDAQGSEPCDCLPDCPTTCHDGGDCCGQADAQGSVAREGEPKTEAGRGTVLRYDNDEDLDIRAEVRAIEAEAADAQAITDNRKIADLNARIETIEAEAVKPWREALQEIVDQFDTYGLTPGAGVRAGIEQARALLDEAGQ